MSPISFRSERDHAAEPALELARWLCAFAPPQPDALTHLKLQKLAFYCYGGLLAFGLDAELGDVAFEAWKHGPVAPAVYDEFYSYGRAPLPPMPPPELSPRAERVMRTVLNVYGRLTAWQLREESHSEEPWRATYSDTCRASLPKSDLRAHFEEKFCGPKVHFPEQLFGASSLLLDRIPVPTFSSLFEMSQAVTRILGPSA